ncbi:MAG: hypothetical protein AAF726_06765 [Planctomycetota bacterium]
MNGSPRMLFRYSTRAALSGVACALLVACGGGGSNVSSRVVLEASNTGIADDYAYHTLGATDGIVRCTASIDANPRATFGRKIDEKFGVVPVRLEITLISEEHQINVSATSMKPVLFLENGVALKAVDPAELRDEIEKDDLAKFDRSLFGDHVLQTFGRSETQVRGYLFFDLPPDSKRDGMRLFIAGPAGTAYTVDLQRSIVQFTYDIDDDGRQIATKINVGTK